MMGQIRLAIETAILEALDETSGWANVEILHMSKSKDVYSVTGHYEVRRLFVFVSEGSFEIELGSNLEIVEFELSPE